MFEELHSLMASVIWRRLGQFQKDMLSWMLEKSEMVTHPPRPLDSCLLWIFFFHSQVYGESSRIFCALVGGRFSKAF